MAKSARSKAEQYFIASDKKQEQFLLDKEQAKVAGREKTARLKALRLAKEVEEKRLAEETAAEKVAAKMKGRTKPPKVAAD